MQQDVRRSDPQDTQTRSQESEQAPKAGGFARSFFQFGGKRGKKAAAVEPGKLQDRLREVLERDRALIASAPEPEEPLDAANEVGEQEVEEHWPEPEHDAEHTHTEMRVVDGATMIGSRADAPRASALAPLDEEEEEEQWPDPASFAHDTPERAVLELASGRESADLAFSQIASWIEEEISELPDSPDPVSLDVPLDDAEAAEIDAVLAGNDTLISSSADFLAALVAPPPAVEEVPEKPVAKPKAARTGAAPVKAKPPEPVEPACEEPIRTLTMARLLAMQGYKPRALAVYRELIRLTPDDAKLVAEMEKLKASE